MKRFLAALLLVASAFAAEKKPVTLEAVAAQPQPPVPAAPVWAPDGSRFAYVEDGKVWLYDIAARSKQALVSLDRLDAAATQGAPPERFGFANRHVREQTIQWFPSGRELLLSAGGDLFVFGIGAGGWRQLTATPEAERDPKLSPDGNRVSFRRGHDLYTLEIASGKVTRLTEDGTPTLLNAELDWVYPEELELETAHWWSPDSRSIAYLQFDVSREPLYPQTDLTSVRPVLEPQRYPRAGEPNADVRLGIVRAGGGRTEWMDLGQTRDMLMARVYWLPDSSGVAVERLNRIQNRLELLFTEAKTGAARVVLRESDPYWINVRDHFRFLGGGREFLWPSERDGFNHLYRYASDGQPLAQLTRGDWEVTSVACVDDAAGQVYYVSSEASPLEQQLYRIGLDGRDKRRITAAAGTHAISMSPRCDYYLDTFSSLTEPTRKTIHASDGSQWAVFSEPERKPLEEYNVLPSEIVPVRASDGATLYARLIKPAGFEPGRKYPAIVEVYGGPGVQRAANRWYGAVNLEQALAQRGYIIWSLDNRGSTGRGHQWESAVFRNFGARELADQKEGIRHLVSLGFVDAARVGIRGWSYGGFMTLYSMLQAPDVFACGVAGAAVTDWRLYDTIYTERYLGLPSENAEGYEKSSPVNAAAGLQGRLLLVHNLEDDNVLFQNTIRMADALQRAGKRFELMVYPEKAHHLSRTQDHFNRLLVSFFDGCLR
ncbi:MAG: S9 family peptidase [Bryobacteraceae bacterium]|jgi:dipeptidyl-peptidase-4